MVVLRESNSINHLSHACSNHGNHVIQMQQNIQSSMSIQHAVGRINQNSVNFTTINNLSLQIMSSQNTTSPLKTDQSTVRFTNGNCGVPSHRYRMIAQTRGECYLQGPSYMAGTGGAPPTGPASMRTQNAPQSAPPPPQDMQNSTMAGHNYVTQTGQVRPQYNNFAYRPTQHNTRPSTHPRQQNYMSGGGAGNAPVMYPPSMMFSAAHMGMPPSYQQPRQQYTYNLYHNPYMNYNNTPSHSSGYTYYPGSRQMPTQSMPPNNAANRNNTSPHVVPQGAQAASSAPPTSMHLTQQQPPSRPIPGLMTNKRSHRIPIIDPDTNKDIFSDLAIDTPPVSGESNEIQNDLSGIKEEFARRVSQAASEPSVNDSNLNSNILAKNINLPINITASPPTSTLQTQQNSITSVDIMKSDILNVNETLSIAVNEEVNDTPVVSALSDSPVIVPKVPVNKKQVKSSDLPLIVADNVKPLPPNNNQIQTKPIVPQTDDTKAIEYEVDEVLTISISTLPPQPQRVKEAKERRKSQDVDIESKEPPIEDTNGPVIPSPVDTIDNLSEIVSYSIKQGSNIELPQKDVNISTVELPEVTPKQIANETPTTTTVTFASNEDVPNNKMTEGEENFENKVNGPHNAEPILNQSINPSKKDLLSDARFKDLSSFNYRQNAISSTSNGNTNVTETVEDIKKDLEQLKVDEPVVENDKVVTEELPTVTSTVEDPIIIVTSDKEPEVAMDVLEEPIASEPSSPPPALPKYVYGEGQWSPSNPTGKKQYDPTFLMQIKNDPFCKEKPMIPKLEQCKVMKAMTVTEPLCLAHFAAPRNNTDVLLPPFAKMSGGIPKREIKKDNISRSSLSGKSLKPSSSSSSFKNQVIHVSLSLSDDVKLNESDNAWKPTRFKRTSLSSEEQKTQEVYKQFRGILNKLTPQKFDNLMEKVKTLEIDNQKRLEGVIDLVFDKAIDEPNFSEAYASMCNKLSKLGVPSDSNPDQCVNFRALIISKCQTLFMTKQVDEHVKNLEQNVAECTDPVKKKEFKLLLDEENRRIRMRSVGNVRFIGELYKLKMLTYKIMVYCMTYLTENCEAEKLECLCKLLTTIGEQMEMEKKDKLDEVFRIMHNIVHQKANKISSRVRFMIQDVIELRKRRWVTKTVVDLQPKMMDQIQKEAEQQHRQTELLNSMPFRREDGGRGKRGDGRRNQNSFQDNNSNWKPSTTTYSVDTSKFKAVRNTKITDHIKLAPSTIKWDQGSGAKTTPTNSYLSLPTTITNNKFSVLDSVHPDPIIPKVSSSGSRSLGVPHAAENIPPPVVPELPAPAPANDEPVTQELLSEQQNKLLKSIIDQSLLVPDDNEVNEEIKLRFKPEHHSSIVTTLLNVAIEKSPKDISVVAKSLLYLVSSNTISAAHFVSGLKEFFEAAPDLYIDIPMLYTYLSKFIVPLIEKKLVTFTQIFRVSESLISANHGHFLLKALLRELKESMGPSFVKSKWQDSALQLSQWMDEEMVPSFSKDFDFLEGGVKSSDEVKKIVTPSEAQGKLLQLMIADETCECIRGWVEDNLGKASDEDWFMRILIQALCEYALFGAEPQSIPHFNQDRMTKYSELIHEFGASKGAREASCLYGIQQLVHRLEHPQGLTLDIFQYLHEQYLISVEGFTTWEESDKEPEGKGVMMKALTSFFTNIKEVDNEDSYSED